MTFHPLPVANGRTMQMYDPSNSAMFNVSTTAPGLLVVEGETSDYDRPVQYEPTDEEKLEMRQHEIDLAASCDEHDQRELTGEAELDAYWRPSRFCGSPRSASTSSRSRRRQIS
jgi:hypothetical protein